MPKKKVTKVQVKQEQSIPEQHQFNVAADQLIEAITQFLNKREGYEYSREEVRKIAVETVEKRV